MYNNNFFISNKHISPHIHLTMRTFRDVLTNLTKQNNVKMINNKTQVI